MPRCFVIQPFDGGPYDNRYEDVFSPAIIAADLEPYRIDQDPAVSIPINDIEKGIRDSSICLADISTDNPNVWFELGFAIAAAKDVVLVCSEERSSKFPFDVQHRSIIKYRTGAPRDFKELQEKITTKLKALIEKGDALVNAAEPSVLQEIDGLDTNEVVALASIGQNLSHPEDAASIWQVKNDMEKNGFTHFATILAVRTLTAHGLVRSEGIGQGYEAESGVALTTAGWDWIIANKSKFKLQAPSKKAAPPTSFDDDIPF